jgi:RND family efflux transporter MFP subunit
MDLAATFSTTTKPRPKVRLKTAVRTVIFLVVFVAAAVVAWSYFTAPLSLAGARVSRGRVADVVYATGFVEPRRPVDVSSRVTAPVTAVMVEEGARVAKGQALATLDAEDQRHSIDQLVAGRVNADQEQARTLALFKQGWITRSARDQAVANASAARAAEASARAKLDQYTIRSGIAGVILRREVEPGDLATAAKTLFQVGDPRQLRVTATVDERDIPLVHTGTVAMMSTEAYPGRFFRGEVYEITPGGDPDQRAFRVRIRPDSPLPVGLTLEVNVMVAQREHALLAPAGAIHDGSVWVIENGRAKRASVQTGIRGTDRTEITRGLSDRACLVADPPKQLKDGQRVIVKGC